MFCAYLFVVSVHLLRFIRANTKIMSNQKPKEKKNEKKEKEGKKRETHKNMREKAWIK